MAGIGITFFMRALLLAVPAGGEHPNQGLEQVQNRLSDMNISSSIPDWAIQTPSPYFRRDRYLRQTTNSVNKSLSRSQFYEEIKAIETYFQGVTGGTFLEMGALDGVLYSNTMVLEGVLGWKGILIEGSPKSYAQLRTNRPNQITINSVICENQSMVHYLEGTRPCCRGIIEFMSPSKQAKLMALTKRVKPVPCSPLRNIFKILDVEHINMFFLDVEGAELSVLQTIDFRKVSFDVLCIEGGKKRELSYIRLLQPLGYVFINQTVKRRINTWFVHERFTGSSLGVGSKVLNQ